MFDRRGALACDCIRTQSGAGERRWVKEENVVFVPRRPGIDTGTLEARKERRDERCQVNVARPLVRIPRLRLRTRRRP